jgi:hypothetical protein
MVTEGLPAGCTTCIEDREDRERSKPGRRSLSSPEELENIRRIVSRTASSSSDREIESQQQTQGHRISFSSAISTPPQSPRLAALPIRNGSRHRCDSSFRKTYDENDRKRAIPCENCALTLPKKTNDESAKGGSGSPTKSGKFDSGGPILRTRKAYERILNYSDEISPKSTPSDSDESERDPSRSSRGLKRTATCTSVSSFASSTSESHKHYIDYTSSHDPMSSASFSILRASCLRTLSCETLPPNTTVTSPSTPTSPLSWNTNNRSFPTNPAQVPSTSGGPIFFGDPQAGYTTAYIFRIPDPYARGRRRVYAFICLSSAHERAAMRAFSFISAAFRDLASWIQSLAEAEADREEGSSSPHPSSDTPHSPRSMSTSITSSSLLQRSAFVRSPDPCYEAATSTSAPPAEDDVKGKKPCVTPPLRTSVFLSGRTFDADGFGARSRGAMAQIRSRGLAELVGRPDFFIELHARFVALLAQLSILFAGSGGSLSV